jgi:hypothetical protein
MIYRGIKLFYPASNTAEAPDEKSISKEEMARWGNVPCTYV